MNGQTLIDTDILIDAGRGVADAVDCLQRLSRTSSLAVSTITEMELIVGCQKKSELRKLEKHLKRFAVVQLNEPISRQAVQLLRLYRLSHGLLMADSLIAATAMTLKVPLMTKNSRDYAFIRGLRLLGYP